MGTINIGRVRIGWKGTWSSATTYVSQDAVYYSGESFVAKLDVPTGTATTNTTYWQQIAQKGADGSDGTNGSDGSIGNTGAVGATGPQGTTGSVGPQGDAGATGATGPQGTTGTQGTQGTAGSTGSAGAAGATGAQGPSGATGDAGSDGANSTVAGPAGANGATGGTGNPFGGGSFTGNIYLGGNSITSVEDISVRDKIEHHGDTDTYMQYHAINQWRVVAGGSESLEVRQNVTNVKSLEINGNQVISTGRGLTNITGVDQATKDMFFANGIGEAPPVGLTFEPNFQVSQYATSTSGTLDLTGALGVDPNAAVWLLLVGGGAGGNNSLYQNNATWKFGGDGGGALMFVGSAQSMQGATYTIASTVGPNNNWQAGQMRPSTVNIASTTYSTNTAADRTLRVLSSTAMISTTGLQGQHFQFSASNSVPILTNITIGAGEAIDRNIFGKAYGGVDSGSVSNYTVKFAGGKAASIYGGSGGPAQSTFSGNGGNLNGNGNAPGGGGSGLGGGGAGGSLRLYWQT